MEGVGSASGQAGDGVRVAGGLLGRRPVPTRYSSTPSSELHSRPILVFSMNASSRLEGGGGGGRRGIRHRDGPTGSGSVRVDVAAARVFLVGGHLHRGAAVGAGFELEAVGARSVACGPRAGQPRAATGGMAHHAVVVGLELHPTSVAEVEAGKGDDDEVGGLAEGEGGGFRGDGSGGCVGDPRSARGAAALMVGG